MRQIIKRIVIIQIISVFSLSVLFGQAYKENAITRKIEALNRGDNSKKEGGSTNDILRFDMKGYIKKTATELLKNPSISSVSIGVYSNGNELSEHFGELDKGKGNLPDDTTIYEIASVTKTMTGFLAAKAVLDKTISLEDDIRKYVDGGYPNLAYQNQPIKIKHLLTHTSGLPAELVGLDKFFKIGNMSGALSFVRNYKKERFFKDLRNIKIKTIPGTKYLYSSNGTNLLGYILERVYKSSYSELLQEHIFEKAGMKNTKLELTNDDLKRLSNGYDGQGNLTPRQPRFLLGADGFVKSTVPDLIKYMKFQLDRDNAIAIESRRKINRNMAPMGYFWQIENEGDKVFFKHAGTAIGTTNWLIIYPEYDTGISIIVSSRFQNSNNIVYGAAVSLLNDIRTLTKKPKNNSEYNTACKEELNSLNCRFQTTSVAL